MRKFILLAVMTLVLTSVKAQKLSYDKLEQLLALTLDQAEEQLFLVGYSFVSKKQLPDSIGLIYNFSNLKQTIGTAKRVSKGIYKQAEKSYVQYTTYDRSEFENFRKLMIEEEFTRVDRSNISENSQYEKMGLNVDFKVAADEYENKTFHITLSGIKKDLSKGTRPKKMSLKDIFRE